MKLRRNEFCPIHRSVFCCGREEIRRERRVRLGVQRVEDPHHARGYRELTSPLLLFAYAGCVFNAGSSGLPPAWVVKCKKCSCTITCRAVSQSREIDWVPLHRVDHR